MVCEELKHWWSVVFREASPFVSFSATCRGLMNFTAEVMVTAIWREITKRKEMPDNQL